MSSSPSHQLTFILLFSLRQQPIRAEYLSIPTPASALIALLFVLVGITDLGSFTLPEFPTSGSGNANVNTNTSTNASGATGSAKTNNIDDNSTINNTASRSSNTIPISVANVYWSTQALIRSSFFFVVTAYAYVFRDVRMKSSSSSSSSSSTTTSMDGVDGSNGVLNAPGGPGANLSNNLVFTLGFLETVFWYWVR